MGCLSDLAGKKSKRMGNMSAPAKTTKEYDKSQTIEQPMRKIAGTEKER
jgi:hypothetical protein